MAYKLLEAAVIVDLCSNAGSYVRWYLKTKMQHWLQWSKTRAFEPLTLFSCTYTSLTWRTTTHGGTTKVTTTGDRAKI